MAKDSSKGSYIRKAAFISAINSSTTMDEAYGKLSKIAEGPYPRSQFNLRVKRYRQKGLLPLDSGHTVEFGQLLIGTSTYHPADPATGKPAQWIKTNVGKANELQAFQQAVEHILSDADFSYIPVDTPTAVHDDLMTIYPIGDAHVGMLAHAAETGDDHDLHISHTRHTKAIYRAVDAAVPSTEAFIIDTGDWYHMDNSSNRTPRGNNPLDVDGRYHKVIQTGFEIATTMILAALSKHQVVRWRSAIGNHNEHSSIMLSYYLEAYFRDEPRVIVHTSPSMFFYHQFGKNLIGITHGHTIKPQLLPSLMATDVPKLWGDTEYRYFYLGHVHHDSVKEMHGCRVETFRTLASKDAWHSASGYRSGQDLKSITLHKDYGEISRNTFNVALIDSE